MSLTIAGNRVALACRDYDAAALNPPLDTPDPTADERAALKRTTLALFRYLPWDVVEDVLGSIMSPDGWPPEEVTDGPPPVAEAVTVTEDDGECD